MKKIISVSRRTDIPAYYSNWFFNRIKDGYVGYVNPFGNQKYIVSLNPENILCFVFWSKNFEPFIKILKYLKENDYLFYLHYTITGLPNLFEKNTIDYKKSINIIKELSIMFDKSSIIWRYDPIIISSITDYYFHIEKFREISSSVKNYVEICYISFTTYYDKVIRNYKELQKNEKVNIINPDIELRLKLANELSIIANDNGIKIYSCCGDYLVGRNIQKGHCIDIKIIEKIILKNKKQDTKFLSPESELRKVKIKPTRQDCGCYESIDIGTYNTCPNGCLYCYANQNQEISLKRYSNHNDKSIFLGFPKEISDLWINSAKKL